MGFSSIVSQIMLMFSMILIITVVIITYKQSLLETSLAMELQQKQLREQLDTNILITNASYNATTTTITIIVKNTGNIALKPDHLDVFVDGKRIPRDPANRTITLDEDLNIINPALFDPEEKALITINKSLSPGNHLLEVVTENGIKNAEIITT